MSSPHFSLPPSFKEIEFVQDWTKFIAGLFTPGEERWVRHNLIAKICEVTPGNSIYEKLISVHGLDRPAEFVTRFLALGGCATPADLTPKEILALGRRLIAKHPEIFKPVEFFSLAGHSIYGKIPELFANTFPRYEITTADFRELLRSVGDLSRPTPLEELVAKEAQKAKRASIPEFDWLRCSLLAKQYLKLGLYSPSKLAASWGLKDDRIQDLAKHQTDLTTNEAMALIKLQKLEPEEVIFLTKPSELARREFFAVYRERYPSKAKQFTERNLEALLAGAKEKLTDPATDPSPLNTIKLKFKLGSVAKPVS